ncbi:MAG: YfcE family phosphodiesterase [Acidobacteria bacterium]|nr:YfcE family phosphodiesterase [Acidobacteriota bacterium]
MKLTVLSDIHGSLDKLAEASGLIAESDLTVVSGDLTRHGDLHELRRVVSELQGVSRRLLAIPGNMDGRDSIPVLTELDVNAHGRAVTIGKIRFIGAGGATPTPFGTPFEMPETEIVARLSALHQPKHSGRLVVICHNPPYGTRLDRIMLGRHVGGKEIRRFVEEVQPDLFLTGHIHEAAGVDRIGKTLLLNPGPFRRGGVGVVHIPETGEITAEIIKR